MCWQLSIMSTLSKLITLHCRGFWRKQRVKCMMWIVHSFIIIDAAVCGLQPPSPSPFISFKETITIQYSDKRTEQQGIWHAHE